MIRFLLTALLGGTIFCAQARAATVVIWPVDPVIAADRNATALWLENKGDAEVVLQVRCLEWTQGEGDDALAPQDDVVVSPPLARVAPGKRQLVRLIRRKPPTAPGERSLRVLVDELPVPARPGADGALSARLAVQMRYSIPLFAYGAAPSQAERTPRLAFRTVTEGGQRFVEIANTGTLHARLTDLRAKVSDRRLPLQPGLAGYVLAGARMRWPLPADVSPSALVAGVNGSDQSIPSAT